MPSLVILSKETVDCLQQNDSLNTVKDINGMLKVLSAHDLAEASIATDLFPYAFDPQLSITVAPKPLTVLNSTNDTEVSTLRDRVVSRYETLKLQLDSESDLGEAVFLDTFTLMPLDESVWVVAWQRQRTEKSDLKTRTTSERAFFDEMIAQCLHYMSFSAVSKTNLMTYYLNTLS